MTTQPLGIRPRALRVATHGQQVASLVGSYPSAEVQSAYSTAPGNSVKNLGFRIEDVKFVSMWDFATF